MRKKAFYSSLGARWLQAWKRRTMRRKGSCSEEAMEAIRAKPLRDNRQVKVLLGPRWDRGLWALSLMAIGLWFFLTMLHEGKPSSSARDLWLFVCLNVWFAFGDSEVMRRGGRLIRGGEVEEGEVVSVFGGRVSCFEVKTSRGTTTLYPGGMHGPDEGDSLFVFYAPDGSDVGAYVPGEESMAVKVRPLWLRTVLRVVVALVVYVGMVGLREGVRVLVQG